jgi:uncharacterized membrane protein
MKEEKSTKTQLLIGFISGLIASLCCVSPLVLALIGLAGVSAALGLSIYLSTYSPLVFLLSGVFLVLAMYFHLKRQKACSMKGLRQRKQEIIAMVITWIVTYVLLAYVIVPYIFNLLQGK